MDDEQLDVVAAGHICVDITPAFTNVSGSEVSKILRPGKLLEVGSPTISTGGPVSNTGLALRRLGLSVSLMGKCGDDPFGEMLIDVLGREAPGAEQGMSVVAGENTSYTIVVAPPGIDRIFLHCPGANNTFGPEDVDLELVAQARLFHFGYPPLMRSMYVSGGRALGEVMKQARNAGAVTSLDLALPDPDSEAGKADWRTILTTGLPHTDIFLPSLEELMFMLDRDRFDELTSGSESIANSFEPEDIRTLAGECVQLGAPIVVIKCGHVGAYLKTSESLEVPAGFLGDQDRWSGVEVFEPTCRVEEIASTTGSGDSSIAGFLAAILRGGSPDRCMKALTVVGAQNLSALDAVSGVKSWEETERELEDEPEKNPLPDRLLSLRG